MDRETVEGKVLAVLSSVLHSEFTPGTEINRQNTLDWNSLKHLEIMFALEEELNVEFSEDELAELDCFTRIVTTTMAKYAT